MSLPTAPGLLRGPSLFTATIPRGLDQEIFVMRADAPAGPNNQPVKLTNNNSSDRSPDFSPDSTRIAFTSARDGDDEIFVMSYSPLLCQGRPTFSSATRNARLFLV